MHLRKLGPAVAISTMLILPAAASANFAHVVMPGETLTSVAAADGLSLSALAAANGLSPNAQLVTGSTLQIPPQSANTAAATSTVSTGTTTATTSGDGDADSDDPGGAGSSGATATTTTGTGPTGYVVQPGDTLTGIAARAGTTVAQLAAQNGLSPNGVLVAGSTLMLSGSGQTAGSGASQFVSSTTSSGGPYPTPERVSGPEIASIASSNGVPAPLAQAIGWQESGWNNAAVSSVGAVGVMQIVPGTWNWIQRTLTAGALSPNSAADNVRGGVALLHSLLSLTGSDSQAAAGYYQGLASVRQHGLYPDTQRYVNDVMSLERQFGGG